MIGIIKEYLRNKEKRKALAGFLAEARSNLEAYYVMFQINRLRFFSLSEWDKVKDLAWSAPVLEYVRRLNNYQCVLEDYKNYEQWYNENLDHKNQENGRVLHQKKETVNEQFKGLENVIKAAIKTIEEIC